MIQIYRYGYAHAYTHVYAYVFTHKYIHICVVRIAYIHKYLNACMNTRARTHSLTHPLTHTHTHTLTTAGLHTDRCVSFIQMEQHKIHDDLTSIIFSISCPSSSVYSFPATTLSRENELNPISPPPCRCAHFHGALYPRADLSR